MKMNSRGGYLKYYGLWEWYDSQPKDVQNFLYKSSGYGINTDSRNLIEGDIEVLSSPDDTYPWTATKFLCQHALNAISDREHSVCKALLEGAFNHAKSKEDDLCYAAYKQNIREKMQYSPDQKQIDEYMPILYQLVKDNPGIKQSDLKKSFPSYMENVVGLAHWANYQAGKIRREKKGNLFQLWVMEEQ